MKEKDETFWHMLGGVRWLIVPKCKKLRCCKGETDFANKEIRIGHKVKGELLIDTIVHDGMEARLPFLAHDQIEGAASEIASLLVKCGVRVIEEE